MILEADVTRGVTSGFPDVGRALQELRAGYLALVADLEPDEWQRASRCHLWSVHEVIRHVRDATRIHLAMLAGDEPPFDPANPFENREVPLRWLAASAGEHPADTVRELEVLSRAERAAVQGCVDRRDDRTLSGPYGTIHWTVATAHVFWDAWIHHRDITEPLGRSRRSSPRQDAVAALYGLLVATVPAALTGPPFNVVVRLRTPSGASFDIHVSPRHAALTPARGSEAADLQGDLVTVVESLAGRGSGVEAALVGDATRREPLTLLRHFMVPST